MCMQPCIFGLAELSLVVARHAVFLNTTSEASSLFWFPKFTLDTGTLISEAGSNSISI
jgi:hypothetical protein